MCKFHVGVSVQGEDLKFHWGSNDSGSDILFLVADMSGEVDDSGIKYIYAYVYSNTATPEQKKLIQNKLENYLHNGAKLDDNIFEFRRRKCMIMYYNMDLMKNRKNIFSTSKTI